MTTSEHMKLSHYIKTIHSDLREKSHCIGVQKAWNEHCENKETLKEYAQAMKALATNHWQKNFHKNHKAVSRVDWIHEYSIEYFIGDKSGLIAQRERELEIANKLELEVKCSFLMQQEKLNLLDVGSCYNPFSEYDLFVVLAIDIAPANPDVQEIDFLNVTINDEPILNFETGDKQLASSYFDIVVFSLFLEYLPSPDLRRKSCEKAYTLLKPEGILFIITPDSKHVGANAQIMKSWRFIMAEMGFSRIKYEKLPHLHCMAFRKCLHLNISKRWADLYRSGQVYNNMFIPQDFSENKKPNESEQIDCEFGKDENKFEVFSILPFSYNND